MSSLYHFIDFTLKTPKYRRTVLKVLQQQNYTKESDAIVIKIFHLHGISPNYSKRKNSKLSTIPTE